MSKKNTLKKSVATILSVAFIMGSSACSFFPVDNEKDLKQKVASVNISIGNEEMKGVGELINLGYLSKDIYKSELISGFLSTGYQYVESYGYSYEETFNMLVDSLVSRKIVTQYAVSYYLDKGLTVDGCKAYVEKNVKDADESMKDLLTQKYALQYFLTENDADSTDYWYAVYQLQKSLNSSLDTAEDEYITAEDEEHNHSEGRAKPTNVSTEKEDFYPTKEDGKTLNYNVYTGRNALSDCGEYEKLDGSTAVTRQKAYNAFLANLQSSNLIKKGENTADITKLSYYYEELVNTLAQAVINKYGDDLKEDAVKDLKDGYVESKYKEIFEGQERAYASDTAAFETALGSVSDDSFVLYGKEGFGFVYNILIPFSAAQEQAYSAAKNKGYTKDELFSARRDILKGVQAKDLRNEWFDLHDHANSAYEATEGYFDNGKDKGEKTYLFFEDNMVKTDRYEALTQYAGMYPYNGKVETVDEEYKFTPNKMDINGFIGEMETYIKEVSGATIKTTDRSESYATKTFVNDGEVDYNSFIYYEGKVELKDKSAANFFNKESDQYKALSAVNELMFAYSTDSGCLNTYMGYVVSPYKTSYVPEFEYAAQYAVSQGVGSYVVCATDYGWHVIYTSFVYEADGEVYGGYVEAEKDTEGTFSNLFYESLKATLANTYITEAQNTILNDYNTDDCVKLYKAAYKDLLELDS